MAITLLTPAQVGDILNRPRPWVVEQARSGKLPGRKVGQRWMFLESDVMAYLDAVAVQAAKPSAPIRRKRGAA